MNTRIALLIGLLSISYVLITWIGSGADFAAGPNIDLSLIPESIDEWVGKEVEIPDDTVQVMQANQHVNRVYRNELTGQEISMHIANWLNKETIAAAPHHPEVCYPAAGWTVQDRRTSQITTAVGDIPIELISFQKGEQRVVTCHWFQVADIYYVALDGFQRQRSRFWGTKAWPSTTKILLQTMSPTIDSAEERLKAFGILIANELVKKPD